MIDEKTFSNDVSFQGVKGLIFIGDRIIVFRRDEKTKLFPLQVDLPGGGREGTESPFETFKRETKEEFGLNLLEKDVCYSKKYNSHLFPGEFSYFIVTKPSKIKEQDIVFGDEGLEYFLINPQDFINLVDGVKYQQERVANYLRL